MHELTGDLPLDPVGAVGLVVGGGHERPEEFRDGSPEELAGKSPEELVDLYLRRSKKWETLKQRARPAP
ncbi:hypothetical protein [Streptomyces sp. NPDC002825]|uniref:hypothetical protein n=1 Tax=Streptomyces sp. NPDC002825 TaxID=3154666 RepID=UPI00332A0DAD